jgi:hypothetical protein
MSAGNSNHDGEQGKAAHGQSLARKPRWLHLAWILAACSDVEPLNIPPIDPDDVDRDGIPNGEDNCPERHNFDQHDEDSDSVGDVCDVCPADTDPDQSDNGETGAFGFGDGIGDACDPRISRDGDRLVGFDGFGSDTSAAWRGTGWAIGADVARAVGTARWEHPQSAAGDGLYAKISVLNVIWLQADARVEVAVNGDGASEGASCAIVRDTDGDGNDEIVAREIQGNTITDNLRGTITGPVTITAWRTIDLDRNATLKCRVDNVEILLPMNDEIPGGTYAFASTGAITDIGSISAYTFPVNPCAFSTAHECPDNI